jgi:hypothetical protein
MFNFFKKEETYARPKEELTDRISSIKRRIAIAKSRIGGDKEPTKITQAQPKSMVANSSFSASTQRNTSEWIVEQKKKIAVQRFESDEREKNLNSLRDKLRKK